LDLEHLIDYIMAMRFQWADWKVEGQLRLVSRLKKDYYRNEMELRGDNTEFGIGPINIHIHNLI
jgi:hypothetical protein